ncbi:signal peptidase II Aspartic peptidase. MEROPS family A08 [Seinonella peptonophila]|uniref:Lipoprotein signal peptidase n=1 Tax=Seinonella peptonophila TaxID=112248 RepID=A0A1M4UYC1_9BACL|nr:signal peptidase II [Seinonella peptonophila]SHE61623.1 signal peptidase II Aspartic peptidase. MEROPS family A08 [Seinonella peptonophila]
MRYYFFALLVIALDQWSKWLVIQYMNIREQIPVIDGLFYITSHRNQGAAFGILQNQRWFFIVVTTCVILFVIVYLWRIRKKQPMMSFAFSLVLGGAIGNLLDRIRMGEVVDFFHFQYESYQFPIFNVADSCIVVGVILLAILNLRESSDQAEKETTVTKAGSQHES